ncbi:MAG: DMT family protein [Bacteroidia bacterium]
MKELATIGLLIRSNSFKTFAWYGHLHFRVEEKKQSMAIQRNKSSHL